MQIGADVLDAELPVPAAHDAFTTAGRLRDPALAAALTAIVAQLLEPTMWRAA